MLQLKKLTKGDVFNGMHVIVYYGGNWFESSIFVGNDGFKVIGPYHRHLNMDNCFLEVYGVTQKEEEKEPKKFTVTWTVSYETEIILDAGQTLEDAIGDIDVEPVECPGEKYATRYVCDTFTVDEVRDTITGDLVDYDTVRNIRG